MKYKTINKLLFLSMSLLSVSLFSNGKITDALTPDLYVSIHYVSETIIERYPSRADVVFIGIGRSPLPIIVDLEVADYKTIHLPLSWSDTIVKKKWSIDEHECLSSDVPQNALLSTEHEKKLYAHFDRFIDSITIDNKHIVLVDYTISGRGLMASEHYLRKYFASADHVRIKALDVIALSLEGSDSLSVVNRKGWWTLELKMDTCAHPIAIKMQLSAYKQYAKYGGFNVDNDEEHSESISENSNYSDFKKRLVEVRKSVIADFNIGQDALILWAESVRFCGAVTLKKQDFSVQNYLWLKTLTNKLELERGFVNTNYNQMPSLMQ